MKTYCDRRVSVEVRDKIQMHHEFRGETVTLFEDRPRWNNPEEWTHQAIAQFRFNMRSGKWTLYCADQHGTWHIYTIVKPTSNLEILLSAVDDDPTRIFFG